MKEQINLVCQRDGMEAGKQYALRVLAAYRNAARFRNAGNLKQRHFAHAMPYRPHFVRAIVEIRQFLKAQSSDVSERID
jgi:hypothetical protein